MRIRMLTIVAMLTGLAPTADAGYKPSDELYGGGVDNGTAAPQRKARHRAPYRECCGGYRFVTAESWYGFKRVVAPVRPAEHGEQVRLPGGTWTYCEFSCEYTLRKQSLDLWESIGPSDQSSPGYFRRHIDLDGYSRH